MKKVTLGKYEFFVDIEKTKKFYQKANGFLCDCKDCINYTLHFEELHEVLKAFDNEIGIDITKDVGIGSDELYPHDYNNYHLYVIPYYVYGEFVLKRSWFINRKADQKISFSTQLSAKVQDISHQKWFDEDSKAFTIWLEFKTPLVTFEEIEKIKIVHNSK